jgi:hypothetical protein
MPMHRTAILVAVGAIALPLLVSTPSAVAASPRRTPVVWLVDELKGSDTVGNDQFGTSVAISGTSAVVSGCNHASAAGRAYVFTKSAKGWKQTAELEGSDTVTGDEFGGSVAVSGTNVVVGASDHAYFAGRAYVFTKTVTGWKQTAELESSDTVADGFGESVAVSGTTVVVGAVYHANEAGRAYVFTKTATGWKQAAELEGSDTEAGDDFGYSAAVSGTTVLVGAGGHANEAGRAYVFTKTVTGWKQTAELKGVDTVAGDWFGESVAISGSLAIVGAGNDASAAGRAYVFTKTATGWKQAAELKGSDTEAGDDFGGSVAVSGTTAIVGASGHAGAAGRAYVFTKTATGWTQAAEVDGSDTVAGDWFGESVAISSSLAIVGAGNHASAAGRAYMFEA